MNKYMKNSAYNENFCINLFLHMIIICYICSCSANPTVH